MGVLAVVVAVLAVVVALVALRRADVVSRQVHRQGNTRAPASPAATPSANSAALQRVAVVHYNAFDDVGGQLSFSAALLDDEGQGIVLTSIHGRNSSNSYAKTVPAQTEGARLSPEENEAVRQALREKS